ncbi:UDP-glucose/GDP-mannose dehydrogenase family protein [Methanosphaera sp. ISO3-F5]|uniref:UDP-glucose dehydrogenase family protein n=1 Tax=Methanosphaera sp. ISO3-F5 TaxID=1452353 RepID=UPI002B2633F3|nr:UDP-glucose/GDP-mannose dehydrogenase family protein [Methanosphaera sp. ISO3-F5]WQH65123.1 UDP-glucose/GDP-mannose dehydrogenase family protein [Methanosphaera sp. ISO3-F5]
MNITIIGTGYVGLVTGTCFSDMGNEVYCVDVLEEKIQSLKEGKIPIYEPGLEELIKRNYGRGNLHFTTNLKEGLDNSELCFIAVGTPMGEDGSADLQYVRQVAQQIGETIIHDMIVVDKSTVPVGTADEVKTIINEQLEKRGESYSISIVSNPEFLKEGNAVNDFMHPDRIVVGADDENAIEVMKLLYDPFTKNHERMIIMDIKSAEMTKYASNSMLANRISFMNEMANICDKIGANIDNVRKGMGSDSRIGSSFLYPGCGYGGSCFPKDVTALIKTATDSGYEPKLLKSVEEVNNQQKSYLVNKIKKVLGEDLTGLTFAIWGLAFKPETDDMREAPSITIIRELLDAGATINAYDPKAMDVAKEFYFKDWDINYFNDKYSTIKNADILIIITEWKEFRSPDFNKIKSNLSKNMIFDGRNQFKNSTMQKLGLKYYAVGK